MGGISGAVTAGIGNAFSTATKAGMVLTERAQSVGGIIVRGGVHAIAQGTLAMMQGGNFFQSFASGALGSLGAAAWGSFGGSFGKFANGTLGSITFGALSGGVGASLTGGNFFDGFVIGATIAAANDALHRIAESSPDGVENGYERDGKGGYRQISTEGGDNIDYLYENGEVVDQQTPIPLGGGEVTTSRTYGRLAVKGTGGATIDVAGEIFFTFAGGGFPRRLGLLLLRKYTLSDFIRTGQTVISNQLVKGPGATGATTSWAIKGGGGKLRFHYHIHKFNWYKPHTWFKQTPIIKPPKFQKK